MPVVKSFGERRFAKPRWLAGMALVVWACAKANEAPPEGAYDPSGGSSGRGGSGTGGSSAQNTGGSAASGGSSATGTGGSAAGSGGTGGAGVTGGVSGSGVGPSGGSTAMGGRSASGGVSPMNGGAGGTTAGASTTGGSGGAMDDGGRGGVANGGSATAGGPPSGGTGAAGLPNDPDWDPPDMVATAKVVVFYKAQQTAASAREVRMDLMFKNQTEADYSLADVTVRYWMSAEPPPRLNIDYSVTALRASPPTFVGNAGVSYVEFSFGATGVVPPYVDDNTLANDTRMQIRIDTTIDSNFNQANDWSYDGSTGAAQANPKITMYEGDTLIWGCDPWHVCAEPSLTGEAGAGGI
jgi:hypothetical protein